MNYSDKNILKNNHAIFTITCNGLTGLGEIERLTSLGYNIGHNARACLESKALDGYDKKHILDTGDEYRVALICGREIVSDRERTSENICKIAQGYGYGEPLSAGIIPRIREYISDERMEKMGILYIACLHQPITVPDFGSRVLCSTRFDIRKRIGACRGDILRQWGIDGAFIFPIPTGWCYNCI